MYLTNCALGPIVLSKDSSRKTTARPAVSAQDWLLGSILGGNLSLVVSGYFSVRSKWGRMCVYSSFPYLFPCLQNALRFLYQGKRMLAFNRHSICCFVFWKWLAFTSLSVSLHFPVKFNVISAALPCPDDLSWDSSRPNCPCFEDNTAYYGNNHRFGGENPQKTRLDCQQSCQFHPSCHYWTFRKPSSSSDDGEDESSGLCYLKLKRENVTPNVTDYVSGSKYCRLPEWSSTGTPLIHYSWWCWPTTFLLGLT